MSARGAIFTAQGPRRAETIPLPSELSGMVPREVRLTGGGIAVAVIAVALAVGALVAAILMSIVYSRDAAARQLRERDGTMVQAEVVQVSLHRGEHPHRIVTYRFEVDGRSYTGRTQLRERDRRAIAPGAPIAAGYVRSHPDMTWLAGYRPDGIPLPVVLLVPASLFIMGVGITFAVRRQWMLLSEGRVARARVVDYKRIRKDKRRAYRVNYEFQTLSGATHTGSCDVGKTPPAIGTTMPIVYHRDNPQWSAAYPMQLVQPARDPRRY